MVRSSAIFEPAEAGESAKCARLPVAVRGHRPSISGDAGVFRNRFETPASVFQPESPRRDLKASDISSDIAREKSESGGSQTKAVATDRREQIVGAERRAQEIAVFIGLLHGRIGPVK